MAKWFSARSGGTKRCTQAWPIETAKICALPIVDAPYHLSCGPPTKANVLHLHMEERLESETSPCQVWLLKIR